MKVLTALNLTKRDFKVVGYTLAAVAAFSAVGVWAEYDNLKQAAYDEVVNGTYWDTATIPGTAVFSMGFDKPVLGLPTVCRTTSRAELRKFVDDEYMWNLGPIRTSDAVAILNKRHPPHSITAAERLACINAGLPLVTKAEGQANRVPVWDYDLFIATGVLKQSLDSQGVAIYVANGRLCARDAGEIAPGKWRMAELTTAGKVGIVHCELDTRP